MISWTCPLEAVGTPVALRRPNDVVPEVLDRKGATLPPRRSRANLQCRRLTPQEHPLRRLPLALACALVLACTRSVPGNTLVGVGGESPSVLLIATLSGASQVPGPGDPDGRGAARITFYPFRAEACFEISVVDIDSAVAARINQGAAGEEGPVVIPLAPPTNGFVTGCTSGVSPIVMDAIARNPGDYYLSVYTTQFPDGALRGQITH